MAERWSIGARCRCVKRKIRRSGRLTGGMRNHSILTQINAVITHFRFSYEFYAGATGCGSGERGFVGMLPIVPFRRQKKNFRPLAN